MKKWDHLVIEHVSPHDMKESGKKGWELVTATPHFASSEDGKIFPTGSYTAFFKRELIEQAEKEDN